MKVTTFPVCLKIPKKPASHEIFTLLTHFVTFPFPPAKPSGPLHAPRINIPQSPSVETTGMAGRERIKKACQLARQASIQYIIQFLTHQAPVQVSLQRGKFRLSLASACGLLSLHSGKLQSLIDYVLRYILLRHDVQPGLVVLSNQCHYVRVGPETGPLLAQVVRADHVAILLC